MPQQLTLNVLIWRIFTPGALPDAAPKGLVSPPGTELEIFYL